MSSLKVRVSCDTVPELSRAVIAPAAIAAQHRPERSSAKVTGSSRMPTEEEGVAAASTSDAVATVSPSKARRAMIDPQPKVGDAFGLGLEEAFVRLQSGYRDFIPEPIEFADGLLAFSDARGYFADPASWPPLDQVAITRLTGRVLDVGAGAGRHTLYLQDKGVDVVAMEPSPGAVRVATARGVRTILTSTIEEFEPGGEVFDAVLMLGSNLGLLRNLDEAPRILRHIAGIVPRGGLLIGDCGYPIGRRHVRGSFGEQIRIRYRDLATAWFWWLFTTPEQLREAVERSEVWKVDDLPVNDDCFLAVLRRTA